MITKETPRYRELADKLRRRITNGDLQPGDTLPTEMHICETETVSRHTARDALRILVEEGLIERRRGAGTVVKAKSPPAFAQSLGDFDSILQYARDARFHLAQTGPADQASLDRTGLTGEYVQYIGYRQVEDQPVFVITAIYVLSDYAPSPEALSDIRGSISEWIEAEHGVRVERVTQRMEAVALNTSQAERLEVSPETPALRSVRRYRDAEDRVVLLSESLHPAGRFAYEIRLNRE